MTKRQQDAFDRKMRVCYTESVPEKHKFRERGVSPLSEKRVRKYYRVLVRRIPPYAFVNGTYDYWEDVYAFSEEGAINCISRYYRKVYGHNLPLRVFEISKEEFKGQHKTSDREEFDYGEADECDN